jgi:hypothetical protein
MMPEHGLKRRIRTENKKHQEGGCNEYCQLSDKYSGTGS